MSDYGHTEPRRGAEWWGKSPLVTLGLFSKVTRRKGGTHSSRDRRNGYVLGLTSWSAVRPPPEASPSHMCCQSSRSVAPATAYRQTAVFPDTSRWPTQPTFFTATPTARAFASAWHACCSSTVTSLCVR
ncbi:hypothetical protein FRT60_26920 [Pseudomonas haemolytica]|uniref:Uncharacterized protein n=1 Tax=Pseudomonas haemolytica TaxID=2600065 RepID=A0A646P4H4_9PSED|nr:hypothetical protein [Pseudomonas haemolytica]